MFAQNYLREPICKDLFVRNYLLGLIVRTLLGLIVKTLLGPFCQSLFVRNNLLGLFSQPFKIKPLELMASRALSSDSTKRPRPLFKSRLKKSHDSSFCWRLESRKENLKVDDIEGPHIFDFPQSRHFQGTKSLVVLNSVETRDSRSCGGWSLVSKKGIENIAPDTLVRLG